MPPRPKSKKLPRSYYARSTLELCPDILGKVLVYDSPAGRLAARIVEVEAYIGEGDPACHASAGKTSRAGIMFGKPGHAYIYFIYGMYHCLNFVTEPEGTAAAILIRGAEPLEGERIMMANSPKANPVTLLSGPGKLCRAFGLTREQNGLDLTKSELWVEDRGLAIKNVATSPRVGITKATRRPWRFFDADSPAVSKTPRPRATRKQVSG